jgi:outer membrane protein assembly factor BamB
MRKTAVILTVIFGCALGWSADWLTDGGDVQRTGWQKNEKTLTTANVKGLKLLWKIQTGNQPRAMHSLFPPLIMGRVTTKAGAAEVAIIGGSSDNIYAIDVAKGTILWQKHFEGSPEQPGGRGGNVLCPGGQTATPVIGPGKIPGSYTVYAASGDGMLHQLNVADGEDLAPPAKFMPANGKPYPLNLSNGVIYTMTAQGCGGNLNLMYAYDLKSNRTTIYSPGIGGMWGTRGPAVGADGTVYTGTGDGIWDPSQKLYGNGIVGVKYDPQTHLLHLEKYFAPANVEFMYKRDLDVQVTPTIFNYKGKEYLVGSSKECRLWLLDTKTFGGDDHQTPLYRTPLVCNEFNNYGAAGVWGALSNWQDTKGVQWVLMPFWGPLATGFHAPLEYGTVTHGAVAAFKLEEAAGGKLTLAPAWISRDMNQADPPVVANGIVFGYGSGEDATQARDDTPLGAPAPTNTNRITNSTHAVLYALDGQTGKELWSSGDEIKSFNHYAGLTVANGRVYIGTWDGIEYCYGLGK